jgi:hypothetical protein
LRLVRLALLLVRLPVFLAHLTDLPGDRHNGTGFSKPLRDPLGDLRKCEPLAEKTVREINV